VSARRNTPTDFWKKVDKNGPTSIVRPELGPCWVWTACVDRDGYAVFVLARKTHRGHKYAYESELGEEVPAGLELDHLCRVRRCVRPSHLEPVMGRVNQLRGEGFPARNVAKTHCPKGHPYDGDNLVRTRDGRACRECGRTRSRELWRAKFGALRRKA
jgi:hypothetical protein